MKHRKVWRSLGYMRPLAIWAMKLAWDKRKKVNAKTADIEEAEAAAVKKEDLNPIQVVVQKVEEAELLL